jgi:hypothetical protein
MAKYVLGSSLDEKLHYKNCTSSTWNKKVPSQNQAKFNPKLRSHFLSLSLSSQTEVTVNYSK